MYSFIVIYIIRFHDGKAEVIATTTGEMQSPAMTLGFILVSLAGIMITGNKK